MTPDLDLRDRLRLMVVTDRARSKPSLVDVVRGALRGGATAVQLREKDLGAGELLRLARLLREATSEAGALLVVNDRLDVALAVGADGVQLGWRSLPVSEARRIAPRGFVIGSSTHEPREVAAAEADGADFAIFGPVHETPSKMGLMDPRGPHGLSVAVMAARLPVVALGGVREGRIADLRRAGACGIAVLSRVMGAPDPEAVVRRLLAEWAESAPEEGRGSRRR